MIFDRAARDLDVIERNRVIGELLIVFVPLASDQHNVPRTGKRNGTVNRFRAIDNFFVPIGAKAFFDLINDRIRGFSNT